jgi:hypothetical protein
MFVKITESLVERKTLRSIAAAAATAPAPARTGGGQLLAGFLQHQFGILAGANHPHHQVVATWAWIK